MIQSDGSWKAQGYTIPAHMLEDIRAYIDHGVPQGDFLHAVISNDLKGAFNHADSHNIQNMFAYVYYFWNEVPETLWGSREAYTNWIKTKAEEREKNAATNL